MDGHRRLGHPRAMRISLRETSSGGLHRVRGSLWPAALAALAAALAWLLAHRVLGHPQPFFAPIAAAIALSTSETQRSWRIVQMVGGVLLGIGIGELLTSLLGTSTVALGTIVLVTMVVALLIGAGFVGQGMMFVNQAAASAILVVALRGSGIGAERAVDALVGGGVAFVIGVLIFPSRPLPRLRAAERALLTVLAKALGHVASLSRRGEVPDPGWMLAIGYQIHDQLARLATARSTARMNVRIAPRRWHLRPVVEAEDRRIAQLDLLANATLSLVRATSNPFGQPEQLPGWLADELDVLAAVLGRLAGAPQPWPESLVAQVRDLTGAIEQRTAPHVDRTAVIAAILRATARDLRAIVGAGGYAGDAERPSEATPESAERATEPAGRLDSSR